MANTKTLISSVEADKGSVLDMELYKVEIDTLDTDLEIRAAVTGYHIGIYAIFLVEGNVGNLTIKSGDDIICVPQFGANSGIINEVKPYPIIFTDKNKSLKISSSIALTPFSIVIGNFQKFYSF